MQVISLDERQEEFNNARDRLVIERLSRSLIDSEHPESTQARASERAARFAKLCAKFDSNSPNKAGLEIRCALCENGDSVDSTDTSQPGEFVLHTLCDQILSSKALLLAEQVCAGRARSATDK